MIDRTMISIVSMPVKVLFLYCKNSLIIDLGSSFLASENKLLLFKISSYLLLHINSCHKDTVRTGNSIIQLNHILLRQQNGHQLHLCCIIQ